MTFIQYFGCCFPKYVFLILDHPCGLTFRPTLQKDRERSVYYLKEATIAKAFIAVMGIEKTPDAMALSHWKKPMPGQVCSFIFTYNQLLTTQRGTVGDFTTTLWEVVAKRSTVMEGKLRIDQLNELLDELSRSGSKL